MRAVPFTRVPVVELWTAKRMLDIGDCASLQLQLASLCSQVRLVSSSRSLQRLSSPKQYVQLLCAARNMLSIRVGAHRQPRRVGIRSAACAAADLGWLNCAGIRAIAAITRCCTAMLRLAQCAVRHAVGRRASDVRRHHRTAGAFGVQ